MTIRPYAFLVAPLMCLGGLSASAQYVVVYSNQFITPLDTPSIATWCQLDFSPDPVNDLWEGTGIGTSTGEFVNTNTVETILVTGPADVYDDPAGIGGDFSIGMLRTDFGDKLGLLIDTEGLPFVNVEMDISAINTTCGGPLPMDTAIFLLELLDAPGGVFNISNSLVLDVDTLIGTGPDADSFIFNWAHAAGSLDVSSSTDGMVALRMTLIRSAYASFDNIYIEASLDSVISAIPEIQLRPLNGYPVPCIDQLTIEGLSAGSHVATIRSVLGQELDAFPITAQGKLDVSPLPAGVYLLNVQEGAITRTLRFVKQ
ncbi:MAG: T9SS type A sorting domain-containing protein [Flavobacteriales bacterium]